MNEFKSQPDLAKDNPGGLDFIDNPHNFSSNPGFLSTTGMLGASAPANGDGVIRGSSARGSVRQGPSQAITPVNGRG